MTLHNEPTIPLGNNAEDPIETAPFKVPVI